MESAPEDDDDVFDVQPVNDVDDLVEDRPSNDDGLGVSDIYPVDRSFRISDPKQSILAQVTSAPVEVKPAITVTAIPSEVDMNRQEIVDDEITVDTSSSAGFSGGILNLRPSMDARMSLQVESVRPAQIVDNPAPAPSATATFTPITSTIQQIEPAPSPPKPSVRFAASVMAKSPVPAPSSPLHHLHQREQSPEQSNHHFAIDALAVDEELAQEVAAMMEEEEEEERPERVTPSPSSSRRPTRAIDPSSHLLASTAARQREYELAEAQREQIRRQHSPSPTRSPKSNAPVYTPSPDLLRETFSFQQARDFKAELERRQEKRDIWWSERKPLPKPVIDPNIGTAL